MLREWLEVRRFAVWFGAIFKESVAHYVFFLSAKRREKKQCALRGKIMLKEKINLGELWQEKQSYILRKTERVPEVLLVHISTENLEKNIHIGTPI